MGIVTEKNVLTQEELQNLQEHLNQSQTLTLELGEIELIKIQLETRYEIAKVRVCDWFKCSCKFCNSSWVKTFFSVTIPIFILFF